MGYEYYDYGYDAGTAVATGFGAIFGFLAFVYIICLAVMIFSIVCMWKIFKKAGKNGWEAIVPIYNLIVMLEITNSPMWYIILFFIPIGNIVAMFLIYINLAKKFGQSTAFGIGLVLVNPIFMGILAFGKNYVYQGNGTINNESINSAPVYSSEQNYNQPINNEQPVMNQPEQSMFSQLNPDNICSNCGAPVNPGDKFCMSCGKQL